MKQKKFILQESEIPKQWYNIQADMKNKPLPPINPATKQPLKAEDMFPIFCEECARQELNQTDAYIDIPEPVLDAYKNYRCTSLVRAYELEKALDTPAHIYFKNESTNPLGSHKLNSALAQAYYAKMEGTTNLTTETGAGQWGAAMSYAAKAFGLEAAVYMVKISYEQKPYRRSIMQTFGAQVTPSPSMSTKAGRAILTENPNHMGSLGTAISEAVELAMNTPHCKYVLGSVLNQCLPAPDRNRRGSNEADGDGRRVSRHRNRMLWRRKQLLRHLNAVYAREDSSREEHQVHRCRASILP